MARTFALGQIVSTVPLSLRAIVDMTYHDDGTCPPLVTITLASGDAIVAAPEFVYVTSTGNLRNADLCAYLVPA